MKSALAQSALFSSLSAWWQYFVCSAGWRLADRRGGASAPLAGARGWRWGAGDGIYCVHERATDRRKGRWETSLVQKNKSCGVPNLTQWRGDFTPVNIYGSKSLIGTIQVSFDSPPQYDPKSHYCLTVLFRDNFRKT